jgi:galactoside O-acetyltransferase
MNYTPEELRSLGISFGESVQIHRSVIFFGAENLSLGSHTRIDCFCMISAQAPVKIGDFVHLGVGAQIYAQEPVTMETFSGISGRSAIYTASEDFCAGYLSGPTVPERFRKVHRGPVHLKKHALVGTGCTLLPGITLGVGSAVGAMTLVRESVDDYLVVAGSPAKRIGIRNAEKLQALEREFLAVNP